MRTDPRADEVRSIVEGVFSGYAGPNRRRERAFPRLFQPREEGPPGDDPRIEETIHIDGGRYVARSYRTPGYMAMWLVAVGIVQFYDERGRMLSTINLFETLRPQRMAA